MATKGRPMHQSTSDWGVNPSTVRCSCGQQQRVKDRNSYRCCSCNRVNDSNSNSQSSGQQARGVFGL